METPALDILLGVTVPGFGLDIDLTPYECPGCPFAGESREPYASISYDEAEAHYPCSLLGRDVWGEGPPCTTDDWRRRARAELEALKPATKT